MSRISILSVFFWLAALIFAAAGVYMADEGMDIIIITTGIAALIAFSGYVIQRKKWGRPKKIANLAVALWIIALTILIFSFNYEGDLLYLAIGSGFSTLLAFIGYKWQLRYMSRAGI